MSWLGKKHSEESKQRMRLAKLGGHLTEEHKRNIGLSLKGKPLGDRARNWKGDNVGYGKLHGWIRRWLPEPEFCQRCGIKPPFDLANITDEYDRCFKNWLYLCRKCHKWWDR